MSPALSLRDLSCVASNGAVLLREVSFDLEAGAILAIAGPNGAGKSTLLNVLSGVSSPSRGEVRIGGRNLHAISPAERARQIAVVGQQDMPDGRLTLKDYVSLGQIPIQSDRSVNAHAEALLRILEMTDLTALANKKMAVLSGGERQRAHIARALAQEPSILFLDEPTNHLDPDAKGRMLSLVAALGITVVMVLHDLVLIPEFATHAALLNETRLTRFGTARAVLTPERVFDTFGVPYLEFDHDGRTVAALDIRNTFHPTQTRKH